MSAEDVHTAASRAFAFLSRKREQGRLTEEQKAELDAIGESREEEWRVVPGDAVGAVRRLERAAGDGQLDEEEAGLVAAAAAAVRSSSGLPDPVRVDGLPPVGPDLAGTFPGGSEAPSCDPRTVDQGAQRPMGKADVSSPEKTAVALGADDWEALWEDDPDGPLMEPPEPPEADDPFEPEADGPEGDDEEPLVPVSDRCWLPMGQFRAVMDSRPLGEKVSAFYLKDAGYREHVDRSRRDFVWRDDSSKGELFSLLDGRPLGNRDEAMGRLGVDRDALADMIWDCSRYQFDPPYASMGEAVVSRSSIVGDGPRVMENALMDHNGTGACHVEKGYAVIERPGCPFSPLLVRGDTLDERTWEMAVEDLRSRAASREAAWDDAEEALWSVPDPSVAEAAVEALRSARADDGDAVGGMEASLLRCLHVVEVRDAVIGDPARPSPWFR